MSLGLLKALKPAEPVVRYERDRAGELLHLDIKKLSQIGRIGHRIHGDRTKRVRGIGWEFRHICVDDASRVAYAEILPDEKKERVTGFTERAIRWSEERCVSIQRIMTDNGSRYRSKLLRRRLEDQVPLHPVLHAPDQREGGVVHPDRPGGVSGRRPWWSFSATTTATPPHGGIESRTPQQRLLELALNNVLEKHS